MFSGQFCWNTVYTCFRPMAATLISEIEGVELRRWQSGPLPCNPRSPWWPWVRAARARGPRYSLTFFNFVPWTLAFLSFLVFLSLFLCLSFVAFLVSRFFWSCWPLLPNLLR